MAFSCLKFRCMEKNLNSRLHLLKIKISGFRLLSDSFELDLTSKARVFEKDLEKEVEEVDRGLFCFHSVAFVGGNSSGKSTVLSLLLKVGELLRSGRWEYDDFDFRGNHIDLCALFYLEGKIYSYSCRLLRMKDPCSTLKAYCPIADERLFNAKYERTKGKKNLLLFEENKKEETDLFRYSLFDTSAISKLTNGKFGIDSFYTNNVVTFSEALVRNSFYASLKSLDAMLVSSIVRLFDESIEYMVSDDSAYVRFKRFGEEEVSLKLTELSRVLSAGTFRGVELYIKAIKALKEGKVLLVDEIENCFHKNLVYNLLFLFNDASLNKNGASILFSTHYVEILDYLSRRDNIFITHKNDGDVTISNLYEDYDVRTELLKSKQFDNNVFNTAPKLETLLEVEKGVAKEMLASKR